jgi:hypothetical protein
MTGWRRNYLIVLLVAVTLLVVSLALALAFATHHGRPGSYPRPMPGRHLTGGDSDRPRMPGWPPQAPSPTPSPTPSASPSR